MMGQDKLLQIHNLTVGFGPSGNMRNALNGINLSVDAGKTLGIVGESGSGKSLTSLAIMGLLPKAAKISSGEIFFREGEKDIDLLKISEKEIRSLRGNKIAMIFQEPMTSLNPVLTCGEQVAEALIFHKKISAKEAKARAIRLFEKVKLPRPAEIFNSYPHQISGGQKQRVMIAMAISCDPSLLIADEPTTALDVTVQKSILELLAEIQQDTGMGMIFISHDLGVVSRIASDVIVMYKGNIMESGPASQVFQHPSHPYTKGLLACRPPVNRKLKALPTISDFMEIEDGKFREKSDSIAEVIRKLELTGDSEIIRPRYEEAPLLEIRNLKKYYSESKGLFSRNKTFVKAVDNVSFKVFKGETVGLVGESGCGKTTLGRSVLRLIEPSEGEIIYKGENIMEYGTGKLRALRKHMQIVFQDPYSSLNPRKTVGEAILEPMNVHGILSDSKARRRKVIELLERVNMGEQHFNQYPHEFSGGQRQRVCIARTLSLNPEFIICDESVSALDVSVQAQVLNLLGELKKDFGFTYIFISHDLSVVKYMSDRMIVMNKGIIEEMGDSEQVYLNPQSDYTKKLISSIPKIEVVNK